MGARKVGGKKGFGGGDGRWGKAWIPVFTGMTYGGRNGKSTGPVIPDLIGDPYVYKDFSVDKKCNRPLGKGCL